MFEFIKGDVVELTPTLAILENNGIAYSINITISTYTAIQGKKNVCLYLYEAIREDAFILYGFAEKTERQMFLLLISVSGVGAGTARVILSSVSVKNRLSKCTWPETISWELMTFLTMKHLRNGNKSV